MPDSCWLFTGEKKPNGAFSLGIKKPAERRVLTGRRRPSLDLSFLVEHVLARDRVVLLDLHLARLIALVLRRGVEVPRVGAGVEADLLAYCLGHALPPGPRPARRGPASRRAPRRYPSCR